MLRRSSSLNLLKEKTAKVCQMAYLPRRSQRLRDKKKNLLTTYIKQIPTVLDTLPMDIISYHIFPYLDYNTRINLNMCLPPWDRRSIKISTEKKEAHHSLVCVSRLNSILNSLNPISSMPPYIAADSVYNGKRRLDRIIEMLGLFLKDDYFMIYRCSALFRNMFDVKLTEFINSTNNDKYSPKTFQKFMSICIELTQKIKNTTIISQYIRTRVYTPQ